MSRAEEEQRLYRDVLTSSLLEKKGREPCLVSIATSVSFYSYPVVL